MKRKRTGDFDWLECLILVVALVLLSIAGAAAACPADFNRDGVLDNGDLVAFTDAYASGSQRADLNGDTIHDNGDVVRFIEEYTRGCLDMPARQNYRGSLTAPSGANGFIKCTTTSQPVSGSTNFALDGGDFGGATTAWGLARIRINDAITANRVLFGLDNSDSNGNTGTMLVRTVAKLFAREPVRL